MNPAELASALRGGMNARGLTVPQLAKAAGVAYETARRATQGESGISLDSTTKLLVAVGLSLSTVPATEEPSRDH